MQNGKKQKMDNEGKSQNMETVQSTGNKEILRGPESELRDKIIFKCSHPHSSEYVDFKVEPLNTMQSLIGRFYNLFCDSDYIVHRHNLEKNHVLTHKKYENTLQQWLDRNGDNWCETYSGWGVNRPKEDARKIIQGILNALYKLHKNGSFHGFLHHPENFAMDSDELVIGGDHKEIKHISLIHANVEPDQSICLSGDGNPQVGKKNDIRAISDVIFNQILRGKCAKSYPKDLRNLYSWLQGATGDTNELGDIVNHPTLWHWKSRFGYIGSVWAYYQHTDRETRSIMSTAFSNICVGNWKHNIQSNSVLKSIYDYPDNHYRSRIIDLLRYLRNARFHYKDYDVRRNCYRHITDLIKEADYLDEQFIELKTTGIDELFLVNLYYKMRDIDLHFKI